MSIFIANWKMHGSIAGCRQWAREFVANGGGGNGGNDDIKIVVCPPAAYFGVLRECLPDGVLLGAQNISQYEDGAYTGEMSATMAAECGCTFAIIGHSERRALFGEDDDVIAAKIRAACAAGLHPVLCVGESEEQKQQGQTAAVIKAQLAAAEGADIAKLHIAYEPVWAIGSGIMPQVADIAQAREVIRQKLMVQSGAFGGRIPVLYGGSVRADNIAAVLDGGDVDGALVGGASLSAAGFVAIARMSMK